MTQTDRKAQPTPGPWRARIVNGGFGIRAGAEDEKHVALLYVGEKASLIKGEVHDVAEANARLIAAAPRMLEALRHIIYASDQCQGHRNCGHSMDPWQEARALLRDVTED